MQIERRRRIRFPLHMDMKFAILVSRADRVQGTGVVVDISSKGLAFRTESVLNPGMRMQASLDWPVLLEGQCTLRLAIEGCVLRCDGQVAVMTIEQYEFRTSGRLGAPSLAQIQALTRQFEGIVTSGCIAH